MKKITIFFVCTILTALLFNSCSGKGSEKAVSSVTLPQHTQAIITFTTGEVQKSQSGQWSTAEINDFISTGDIVKAGMDAYCEIQFGNRAVIKIEENTELVIPAVNTTSGQTDISLKVITGSVLSKVSKLAGDESFTIQTQSAACGVRGTEFMVSADNDLKTLLAVKEGAVVFSPADLNLAGLKAKIPPGNTAAAAALDSIEGALAVVESSEEITLSPEDFSSIKASYTRLEKTVALLSGDKAAEPEHLKEIQQISDSIVKELSQPEPVSGENRIALEPLDAMVIRQLPEPGKEGASVTDSLVKVTLVTVPDDASISRDGKVIGKGDFSAIYSDGEEVSLVISRKGYFEKTLSFTASRNSENRYEISLEKNTAEKESFEIMFKVLPEDSEILVDGVPAGKGTAVMDMLSDSTYNILFRKEGYQKKYLAISEPKENQSVEIQLLPSIEKRIKVSGFRLTGQTEYRSRMIYTADTRGEIIAADASGAVIWRVQTGNSPNEQSFPVLSGNNVFFSGANEFLTIDSRTGSVINTIDLDDDSSHVFGRKVAFTGNTGIYPANSKLITFNPSDGSFTGEIPIPEGTRMSAGIKGSEILIVNQKGMFYRIDSATGKVNASVQTKALQPVVNSVAVAEDRAFFNGRSGEIVCINLSDNAVLWTVPLSGGREKMITGDLRCSVSGVYAFSDNQIHGFSAANGERLFNPLTKASAPPALAGSRLYFGTTDSQLLTADAATGAVIEAIRLPAAITAAPVYANGKIYAGTESGEVLVLNP